jgi:hypothetical protein
MTQRLLFSGLDCLPGQLDLFQTDGEPEREENAAMRNLAMSKELTPNQVFVIEELRRQGCEWIAEVTEREWRAGRAYYIDDRVKVHGVRHRFQQGNKEATE